MGKIRTNSDRRYLVKNRFVMRMISVMLCMLICGNSFAEGESANDLWLEFIAVEASAEREGELSAKELQLLGEKIIKADPDNWLAYAVMRDWNVEELSDLPEDVTYDVVYKILDRVEKYGELSEERFSMFDIDLFLKTENAEIYKAYMAHQYVMRQMMTNEDREPDMMKRLWEYLCYAEEVFRGTDNAESVHDTMIDLVLSVPTALSCWKVYDAKEWENPICSRETFMEVCNQYLGEVEELLSIGTDNPYTEIYRFVKAIEINAFLGYQAYEAGNQEELWERIKESRRLCEMFAGKNDESGRYDNELKFVNIYDSHLRMLYYDGIDDDRFNEAVKDIINACRVDSYMEAYYAAYYYDVTAMEDLFESANCLINEKST